MKKLSDLSVRDLVHELLRGGDVNFPKPVDKEDIVKSLEKKTNKNFGEDLDAWVNWFCSKDTGFSPSEKESIKIVKRLVDLEKKYIPKILRSRPT